jgi:RsiW-degrading membrane proteinase PrsW (M82 family)
MILVGLFTGTLGILLLLGFQFAADMTQYVWLRGRGIVVVLFYIVKFIGFSYRAAEDPSNGFLLSFMGFTCGVGFCEELCKALPLLWHFKTKGSLGWRGACIWGLVSGAGFGVAEAIMYSGRYYNGVHTGGIYAVRFISCVGLHAVWAAAVGVTVFRNQARIQGETSFVQWLGWSAYFVLVPMVLHGAYDTLLKQDYHALAVAVAVASFAWLAFQIERAGRLEKAGWTPLQIPGGA